MSSVALRLFLPTQFLAAIGLAACAPGDAGTTAPTLRSESHRLAVIAESPGVTDGHYDVTPLDEPSSVLSYRGAYGTATLVGYPHPHHFEGVATFTDPRGAVVAQSVQGHEVWAAGFADATRVWWFGPGGAFVSDVSSGDVRPIPTGHGRVVGVRVDDSSGQHLYVTGFRERYQFGEPASTERCTLGGACVDEPAFDSAWLLVGLTPIGWLAFSDDFERGRPRLVAIAPAGSDIRTLGWLGEGESLLPPPMSNPTVRTIQAASTQLEMRYDGATGEVAVLIVVDPAAAPGTACERSAERQWTCVVGKEG